jgi:ureidoglycolate lyase
MSKTNSLELQNSNLPEIKDRRDTFNKIGGLAAIAAAAAFSDLGSAYAQPSNGALIPALDPNNPFSTAGGAPKTTANVHTTRRLKVDVATPENFAQFGRLLTPEGRKRLPVNTYGDKLDLYREDFSSDQPIEWFIFQGRKRWNGVLFLERHQQLTQTFIPLGGKAFYTVVAPANCKEENGFPALSEMRAFIVPGDAAIQLFRATWHENPMPVQDDTRMLVTSHAALTYAHQQNPDPNLKAQPTDLERRWYKPGGYDLTLDV